MKNMMPEYVDELKGYDIDMLEHNLDKNAKDYKVDDLKSATLVIQSLLDKALKKVGVNIAEDSTEEGVDFLLKRHNVKVEHRKNYTGDDTWRNGIYVYKGMDLVGFISEPLFKKPDVFAIDRATHVVVRAALQ